MEAKKTLLTYTGLKKLEDELENLKVVKRKEVAGKIKEAREQGDLSENAEYDAAKDEQRDIEARIEELEKILKNAEVVVEDDVDLDTINIGCTVDVYDKEFEEEIVFQLVGSTEANSLEGKISNESPVGKALIGKKVERSSCALDGLPLDISSFRPFPLTSSNSFSSLLFNSSSSSLLISLYAVILKTSHNHQLIIVCFLPYFILPKSAICSFFQLF